MPRSKKKPEPVPTKDAPIVDAKVQVPAVTSLSVSTREGQVDASGAITAAGATAGADSARTSATASTSAAPGTDHATTSPAGSSAPGARKQSARSEATERASVTDHDKAVIEKAAKRKPKKRANTLELRMARDGRPPLKIAVLSGGISHERDVSLRSGRRVADALVHAGHDVTVLDPDANLLDRLRENQPHVIFPALHGSTGENGALQALLAALDMPFVGSRAESLRLAWNKATSKELLRREGISTPDSITVPRETFRELGARSVIDAIGQSFTTPLVVKPVKGGSAQGVTIVRDINDLPRAMVDAYTYVDAAIIERFIEGTEVTIGVIDEGNGPRALPATEIVPVSGTYDFSARYNAGETTFYTPARLNEKISAELARVALHVHEALQLRHVSRIDTVIDAEGTIWVIDVNTLPGMTETSLIPMALEAAGLNAGDVYASLARAAYDAR